MASRRLKSDRFFTADYTPHVYTQVGLDWIENNNMITVLLRHYPQLGPALHNVPNAFAPWKPVSSNNTVPTVPSKPDSGTKIDKLPPTVPSKPESWTKIDKLLAKRGLTRVQVKGDGRCQLRAIAITLDQGDFLLVRQKLIDYINFKLPEQLQKIWSDTRVDRAALIAALERDNWEGDEMLIAAANCFHVRIEVITSKTSIAIEPLTATNDTRTVLLAFNGRDHYDAVVV